MKYNQDLRAEQIEQIAIFGQNKYQNLPIYTDKKDLPTASQETDVRLVKLRLASEKNMMQDNTQL